MVMIQVPDDAIPLQATETKEVIAVDSDRVDRDRLERDQDKRLFESLVFLTDTLVSGFDVIDLADRLVHASVDLLDMKSAGILLGNQQNALRVIAASSEETRTLELLELLTKQGPCLEAFATGREVSVPDLANERPEWKEFVELATSQGIVAAHSFPMRLRDHVIGALNLFSAASEPLTVNELQLGRVLTDMATIGILSHRAMREQEILAEQLQHALSSRVIIEQAKGMIAERGNVDMRAAFSILRESARTSRRSLTDVASDIAGSATPSLPLR